MTYKKIIWQIEYFLIQSEQIIDPLVLPKMNIAYLKDKLSFKNPREMEYEVITSPEAVDYRWHFAVYLRKEVRENDFRKFENAVSLLWRRKYSEYIVDIQQYVLLRLTESKNNQKLTLTLLSLVTDSTTDVTIVHQEEHIDSFGHSFWKLVTFVREDSFIDSQVTADLDINKLQLLTNFTGTDDSIYKLESKVPDTLKRYDISFSFFVSSAIKKQKLTILSKKIEDLWKNTGLWNSKDNVKIDIRKQDKYLTNEGLLYKVIYYLSVNAVTLDSNQFQNTNSTKLKDILQSLSSTTENYNLIEKTKTFRYEEQFSFLLTKPVLMTDKHRLETQLKKAWIAQKSGIAPTSVKLQILLQDEFVGQKGKSLWRVLYALQADNITLKSTQEGELTVTSLNKYVNLTETGTNKKYTDYLEWTPLTLLKRYQELFVLHFSQRFETKNYKKLADKIKLLWNNTNGITGVKILKQEKVLDKSSKAVWSVLYSLESSNMQHIDNVLVSQPSFQDIKRAIQILSPLGKHYELVDIQKYYRLSQTFQVTFNRRIYKKDIVKFNDVLKSFLENTTKGFTWTAGSNFILTKEDHVINTNTGF
ncbi:hypothetical protein KUTeg_017009 [Tegillarca granosa]|uniref:Uncharacterized protein n=1 Tax=Tegillarca granosa TaxID=220873 RepID=A0ABQ9ENF6_TEGGR|nr:hypothetical protein KUTeg_017009 [Tegillarca granosa]